MKYRVAVTDNRFDTPYDLEREVLEEAGAVLELCELTGPRDAEGALAGVDAILVNHFSVSDAVIRALDRCRIISRYGTGYDNVDVDAAAAAGIWVSNVPDYATEDVSDHALALLMGCVRRIVYRHTRIHEGGWYLFSEQKCRRVRGRVLGIVGYGRIGRALHRKVNGLGLAEVLVSDPYVPAVVVSREGARSVTLEELLARSDYISINAALTPQTRGLIGARELAKTKPGAILINTARGPIVDEDALVAALRDRRLDYAGLDVYAREPLAPDHELRRLDNVILSDHAAWYTEESQVEMRVKAAKNVLAVLRGGPPVYPVNTPRAPQPQPSR